MCFLVGQNIIILIGTNRLFFSRRIRFEGEKKIEERKEKGRTKLEGEKINEEHKKMGRCGCWTIMMVGGIGMVASGGVAGRRSGSQKWLQK